MSLILIVKTLLFLLLFCTCVLAESSFVCQFSLFFPESFSHPSWMWRSEILSLTQSVCPPLHHRLSILIIGFSYHFLTQ